MLKVEIDSCWMNNRNHPERKLLGHVAYQAISSQEYFQRESSSGMQIQRFMMTDPVLPASGPFT